MNGCLRRGREDGKEEEIKGGEETEAEVRGLGYRGEKAPPPGLTSSRPPWGWRGLSAAPHPFPPTGEGLSLSPAHPPSIPQKVFNS